MTERGEDEHLVVYGRVVAGREVLAEDAFDGDFLTGGTMRSTADGREGARF